MGPVEASADLVLEHVDRAASLWKARSVIVRSRVHGLWDLATLDHRIRAHLHGAVVAGPGCWTVDRWPVSRRPQMAFVAMAVAGLMGDRDRIEDVVQHYDDPAAEPALISGLGWLPWERVAPLLEDWLGYHAPRWRALALAAAVAHRRDPRAAIDRGLLDGDRRVQRHAIRACGVFGRRSLVPTLVALASEPNDDVRCQVATALVRLGQDFARILLWEAALRLGSEASLEAAEHAVRQLPVETARRWIDNTSGDPRLRRHVLVAAAATGSPRCVHHLLAGLDDPKTAALATYGLATVFGLNPYAVEAGTPVEEQSETELPEPDAATVRQWWDESKSRFDPHLRWQGGQPRSAVVFRELLLRGVQHERRLAAYDLFEGRAASALPFEVDAPGWCQLSRLGWGQSTGRPGPRSPKP